MRRLISRFLRWRDQQRQPQHVYVTPYQYQLMARNHRYRSRTSHVR